MGRGAPPDRGRQRRAVLRFVSAFYNLIITSPPEKSTVSRKLAEIRLFQQGLQFYGGDGIVTKGVENTIANVGRLAREGMRGTDCEILDIMVGR